MGKTQIIERTPIYVKRVLATLLVAMGFHDVYGVYLDMKRKHPASEFRC